MRRRLIALASVACVGIEHFCLERCGAAIRYLGRRSRRHGPRRQTRRQLLPLRERHLAEDGGKSRRIVPAPARSRTCASTAKRRCARSWQTWMRDPTPRCRPKRRSCAISTTPSSIKSRSTAAASRRHKKISTYIASLKTLDEVATAMGDPRLSADGPFNVSIGVDQKDPNAYAIDLEQSGLGLPDRDYYLREGKEMAATRDAYKKYLAIDAHARGPARRGQARRRDLRPRTQHGEGRVVP